jgi:hypothetical protein
MEVGPLGDARFQFALSRFTKSARSMARCYGCESFSHNVRILDASRLAPPKSVVSTSLLRPPEFLEQSPITDGTTMKIFQRFRSAAVTLASAGLLLPQTTTGAAEPSSVGPSKGAAVATSIQDVALAPGGTLQGQVLNPQGIPLAQTRVSVLSGGQEVASTHTDADGNFVVNNLRGGSYTVIAGDGGGIYRLWTDNSAPPHAGGRVLIVSGRSVARGQLGGGAGLLSPTGLAILGFAGGITAAGLATQGNQENLTGS